MTTATATRATNRLPLRMRFTGLHATQVDIFRSPARFRVVAGGRRSGKTRLGVALCLHAAALGQAAWWVAPSFKVGGIGWRQIRAFTRRVPDAIVREGERRVELPSGGWVQVKSADNPDSLRGEGLDRIVLDEAAYMGEAAWTEALRPALSDRQGGALFISTPNGRNWFWRLWQGATGPGWARWQFPTSANPYIDSAEIATAKERVPERVFRQEYLAEFIEDGAGIFRGVLACATAARQSTAPAEHTVVFGVDWAKHEDWTVIVVLDADEGRMLGIDRFNQIDYATQLQRLKVLAERFRPTTIIAERNSMGEPLIEQLQRMGLPVEPFTTTNASKAQAIDALSLAFERQDIKIIPDDVLLAELQAFQATRLPSGLLRYEAPAGMHDDCVIALALAWQGVANQPEVWVA